ncbi:TPA: LysE family transporter [Stenotrophomonas maltophilia]|nr:LysE family transporter [Stenotrophomonas maltophilia]
MEQFLIVATVHFLALLSPGPDFFLVARTAVTSGWRTASGACAGIAFGNGVFIVAAFTGIALLRAGSAGFVAVQLAGCGFLLYLGVLFLRHAGATALQPPDAARMPRAGGAHDWWKAAGLGALSALLNPKNALFYATLAAMLNGPQASTKAKLFYAAWMFGVVLLWDLLVAALIGHPWVMRRFARLLPWLERAAGMLMIALALWILVSLYAA